MFRDEFSECDFAVRAVVRMGDAVLPLLEKWGAERHTQQSDFALRSLRAIGPARGLKTLERLTQHENSEVRRASFGIIASWDDPVIGDVLLSGISNPDGAIRSAALTGLRRIQDRRVVPVALQMIGNDRNGGLQEGAASSLGVFYETAFLKPLVRLARSAPDVGARRTGSNTLRRVSDPVANRLGLRYEVISVSPAAEGGIALRYKAVLLGTAVIILVALRLARLIRQGQLLCIALLAIGGYFWGNVITKINGSVERELWFFWIPAVWLVARVMGTKMSNLKDLAIPFVVSLSVGVMYSLLRSVLARLSPGAAFVMALYGWVPLAVGFLVGCGIVLRRLARRRAAWPAREHDVAFTRLATLGCLAFYGGYLFGWWKLWDYSIDAFRLLP